MIASIQAKGYEREQFTDAWLRYARAERTDSNASNPSNRPPAPEDATTTPSPDGRVTEDGSSTNASTGDCVPEPGSQLMDVWTDKSTNQAGSLRARVPEGDPLTIFDQPPVDDDATDDIPF
jgi:hypothetical protein